jgi:hypothetical protein
MRDEECAPEPLDDPDDKGVTHEECAALVADAGSVGVSVGEHAEPFQFNGGEPAVTSRACQYDVLVPSGCRAALSSDDGARRSVKVVGECDRSFDVFVLESGLSLALLALRTLKVFPACELLGIEEIFFRDLILIQ